MSSTTPHPPGAFDRSADAAFQSERLPIVETAADPGVSLVDRGGQEGDWQDTDTEGEPSDDIMSESVKPEGSVGGRRESQASSSARPRTPLKARRSTATTPRPAASPRRRTPRKAGIPPSPRPRDLNTTKTRLPPQPSVLRQAVGLFLTTLRVLWTIFDWLISPVKPYLLLASFFLITAYLAYCTIIYYALPRIPTLLLRSLGILLRPLSAGGWSIPLPSWESLNFSSSTLDLDVSRGIAALSLPITGLATSSCALLGIGCQASIYTTDGRVAKPFWQSEDRDGRPEVDDAQLAWALTQESRSARNIFESISTLGNKADVFEHIEIWKHGVAVSVESKLDDRNVLGKQLFALGDSSKDLHDEMRRIDSMTVTTFGNLHLEFNDLASQLMSIQLLDPPDRSDTSVTLARRFDNILNRLDPKLDDLILRVSHAVDIAQSALDQSKDTTLLLSQISHELNDEISSVPAWKRVSDQLGHYINGGETPRSKTVKRDLKLVKDVVRDISSLLDNLERARSALLDYQSHTAGFKASLYGVHLAANGTLDLESELRILSPLMTEFGTALNSAKSQRFGRVDVRTANILDPAPPPPPPP